MFFITFILGLVALIADEQFGGQHTAGVALLIVTTFLVVFQLLLTGLVFGAVAKGIKSPRMRRGF